MPAKKRESAVEAEIRTYAVENGCIYLKLAGAGQRGQPDRMILKESKVLFLEIKRPGKKPEPLQLWWAKKLRAHGFTAEWCDNSDRGCELIRIHLL